MADPVREQRELVLAPNEFCFVQNSTDGGIVTCVGPLTVTLGQSEVPIIFDPKTKRFVNVNNQQGRVQPIQQMIFAPAGWYVVLLNPSKNRYPQSGKKNTPEDLEIGKRVVIPGPVSFAMWPGQMATVVEGHRLRSNEYLLIEIYDDVAARTNWARATVQTASTSTTSAMSGEGEDKTLKADAPAPVTTQTMMVPADLANGKRYIIKGTEIAFYIPPTGVKVVEDNGNGNSQETRTPMYVRQAVSLENLEYAILLDESGDKEYLYGPNVVFPKPTQTFIRSNNKIKYRAIELDARKGLYIKIIEDYEVPGPSADDGGTTTIQKKAGEELFITGDGIIYQPRKEHSIIKYGEQEVHHAIAMPEGDGWYVLNRTTGEVFIVRGPKMYLPDPRTHAITRRILTEKEASLFYPGNKEAALVNKELMISNKGDMSASSLSQSVMYATTSYLGGAGASSMTKSLARGLDVEDRFGGDSFERNTKFTEPRTVILNTKYMGAIPINVWTGYAVKIVDKTGAGRVVIGPQAFLLEYDETLEPMSLSTGKPKSTDRLFDTVYLKTKSNRVSDIIEVDTFDMIKANIKVSYRVDFINDDDPLKWFGVENYVKFLCDHIRSIIKSVVRKITILELHQNLTNIVRDSILGVKEVTYVEAKEEDKEEVKEPAGGGVLYPEDASTAMEEIKSTITIGSRPGLLFTENNMKVYDVEVLDMEITNSDINKLIQDNERKVFSNVLTLKAKQHEARVSKEITLLTKQIMTDQDTIEEAKALSVAKKQENDLISKKKDMEICKAILNIEDAHKKQEIQHRTADLEIGINQMKSETDAATKIASVFTPHMIEAINNLKDATVIEALSANFSDLAILEGNGILATATRFLDILPQGMLEKIGKVTETE